MMIDCDGIGGCKAWRCQIRRCRMQEVCEREAQQRIRKQGCRSGWTSEKPPQKLLSSTRTSAEKWMRRQIYTYTCVCAFMTCICQGWGNTSTVFGTHTFHEFGGLGSGSIHPLEDFQLLRSLHTHRRRPQLPQKGGLVHHSVTKGKFTEGPDFLILAQTVQTQGLVVCVALWEHTFLQ